MDDSIGVLFCFDDIRAVPEPPSVYHQQRPKLARVHVVRDSSFEELLGYCNEVYKKNQSDLSELEDHLRTFGYAPEPEIDEKDETSDDSCVPLGLDWKMVDTDPLYPLIALVCSPAMGTAAAVVVFFLNIVRLEDSLSLQDLGLSDVCLATIASQELTNLTDEKQHGMKGQYGPASKFLEVIEGTILSGFDCSGEVEDDLELVGVPQSVIKILKDDYESLPSYMKTLASWEHHFAGSTCSCREDELKPCQKQITKGRNFIHQDEIASLGLGLYLKAQSEVLPANARPPELLVVETIDGLVSYRVL
ncbi:hypothetical protein C3L33_02400, partial [Rhododendron williamsianum]